LTWASCDFWRHAATLFCWGMLHMLVAALYSKEIMGIAIFKQMHQEKVSSTCIRKRLTYGYIRSIFFIIFLKGALLMYGYEMVSMMYANTENRVRNIAVYNYRQSREE